MGACGLLYTLDFPPSAQGGGSAMFGQTLGRLVKYYSVGPNNEEGALAFGTRTAPRLRVRVRVRVRPGTPERPLVGVTSP